MLQAADGLAGRSHGYCSSRPILQKEAEYAGATGLCYLERRMARPCGIRGMAGLALPIALTIAGVCAGWAGAPRRGDSSERVSQVVATLATGRVTAIGGHDGLVVAAIGTSSFEPDSLPPLIVPLADGDIAVVLGADDWIEPAPANRTLLRIDQRLPSLANGVAANAPSLNGGTNPSDLDQLGLSVLEPLRSAASNLHEQIHLPEDLPLAELVLIQHSGGSPLSVWDVSYWIQQKFWQENFWATEVERPRYMQLYPTKQDRSDMVDVSYPPGEASDNLSGRLSNPTGPFAQAIQANPKLAAAQRQIANGKAGKVRMAELVPLVKAALETMVPSASAKAMAAIDDKNGFSWVIQPPVSAKPAVKRPAGAPTLGSQPAGAPTLGPPE
jgi:hypothetical protein